MLLRTGKGVALGEDGAGLMCDEIPIFASLGRLLCFSTSVPRVSSVGCSLLNAAHAHTDLCSEWLSAPWGFILDTYECPYLGLADRQHWQTHHPTSVQ